MSDKATSLPVEVLQSVSVATHKVSTTFGDLFFGTYDSPWALVLIGVLSGLAGMISHWVKKYYTEEQTEDFFKWFFVNNQRGAFLAAASTLGALFAAFSPLDYTTITSFQVFTQAWAIGYAADSMFNSNKPQRFRRRRTMDAERASQVE